MGKQLVVALFADEAAADEAVQLLKSWDKASDEVKLGAIGVLVKDEKGKIKTHKMGSRRTVGGAILFGLAGLLSGGITVIGGVIGGAILGSLFRKGGVKISEYELAALGSELDGGKAAVGLMAEDAEAGLVKAKLIELGGAPTSYEVSREAVDEAVRAAAAAPAEEVPAEGAEEETPETGLSLSN
jgi:uncharacterized membrane protein